MVFSSEYIYLYKYSPILLPLPRKLCLAVCLSVCKISLKSFELISMKLTLNVDSDTRNRWFNYISDMDHRLDTGNFFKGSFIIVR